MQTYCCWQKEFGGLKLDHAERLKEPERENAKLKPLLASCRLQSHTAFVAGEGLECIDPGIWLWQ